MQREWNWKGDQYKQYISICSELCVIGKLILRGTRIVIPSKLRLNISALAHDGHLGVISTPAKLDPIN